MKNITFTESELNDLKSFYYDELDKITRRMEIIKGFLHKLEVGEIIKEPYFADNLKKVNTQKRKLVKKATVTGEIQSKKISGKGVKDNESVAERKKSGRRPKREVEVTTTVKELRALVANKKKETAGKSKADKVEVKTVKSADVNQLSTKKVGRKSKWGVFVIDVLKSEGVPVSASLMTDIAIKHFKATGAEVNKTRIAVAGILSKLSNREKKLVAYNLKGVRGKSYCLPEWFDNKGKLKDNIVARLGKK